jgi:hypothetical protein
MTAVMEGRTGAMDRVLQRRLALQLAAFGRRSF